MGIELLPANYPGYLFSNNLRYHFLYLLWLHIKSQVIWNFENLLKPDGLFIL